jgi:NAD+ kinase
MSLRCLGLIANPSKPGAKQLTHDMSREFTRHGLKPMLDAGTAELIGEDSGFTPGALSRECDLLVVLGGDGTILQVLHELEQRPPPMFGINLGTLGFLTTASAAQWLDAVNAIVREKYVLSERTLLSVEIRRDGEFEAPRTALNDAVISRGELSRLIRLDVCIDGAFLTEYNADGLIVATPTGSTAYSLSAGGPVLSPDSGVFVVTPICPHVLTLRSVMVSDQSVIEISHSHVKTDIFLTLDGQNAARIGPGDAIRIRKAAQQLSLAMLPGMSFFEVLRQKLKWSGTAV